MTALPAANVYSNAANQGVAMQAFEDMRDFVAGSLSTWIPARDFCPTITNGAERSVRELATNDLMVDVLLFPDASSKFATVDWVPDEKWNGGTVTFEAYCCSQGGSAAQTAEFELSGVAISHDDPLDAAPGTAQASTATRTAAADDLLIGTTSSAITIAGTPATADLVQFKITRDHATDNLGATAELAGILLHWSAE